METTLTIERPDTPDVLNLLRELDAYYEALYQAESLDVFRTLDLVTPHITFFVLRYAGSVVGCGALSTAAPYGELKRVYIRPAYRSKGLGRHIVIQICLYARARNMALVRLDTGIYQPEALRLYESMGFRQIDPFGAYANDPYSLFYEVQLNDAPQGVLSHSQVIDTRTESCL